MYHYVRELRRSRYPSLKGLDLARFREQLRWAVRHHEVVRMEQVLAALAGVEPLPKNALLLTFDDGYSDHYAYAFPILDEMGLEGSFYPVASAVERRTVLAANKVQLVLAACDDATRVTRRLLAWLAEHRSRFRLEDDAFYLERHAHPTRFDPPEVVFVKRMLQRALPAAARAELLDTLFTAFVGVSEATIAEELYASFDQLRTMHRHGMHIGAHGVEHHWMTTLGDAQRTAEIEESRALLRSIGVDTGAWTMAYPYGDVDDALCRLAAERGCAAAFTIEPERADMNTVDALRIPRLDTNDLPPPPR